jgi:hypothetical protein
MLDTHVTTPRFDRIPFTIFMKTMHDSCTNSPSTTILI